ncbi:MAG TPA: class I SAM-dependent methyltransferase [Solirubrobacteraceae bacterium]|jgi:SAM-dependent methyltransferase|nr:class I SAM-dependent methyltransferase [Solirubrobacteraceae bacterium]
MLSEILPERDPRTHIERKAWELAMLALFLRDAGRLHDGTEALAVGAGDERIVFWLANRVGRIVATDIYGAGHFAKREAVASMLADPRAHAPFPYREDRLEVSYMDGRGLAFPDESFDVVFSVSSIEHFGAPGDIARGAREIGRVLRPGGHAVVITECFVRRHPLSAAPVDFALRVASLGRLRRRATPRRRAGVDVLTARELERWIVRPSGLELLQPLDRAISARSYENVTSLRPGRKPAPATGSFYPHVLLQFRGSVFTSVCLAMHKPGPRSP